MDHKLGLTHLGWTGGGYGRLLKESSGKKKNVG